MTDVLWYTANRISLQNPTVVKTNSKAPELWISLFWCELFFFFFSAVVMQQGIFFCLGILFRGMLWTFCAWTSQMNSSTGQVNVTCRASLVLPGSTSMVAYACHSSVMQTLSLRSFWWFYISITTEGMGWDSEKYILLMPFLNGGLVVV